MNDQGFLLADALTLIAACLASAMIIVGLSTAAFNDRRIRMQTNDQIETEYRSHLREIEPCKLCTNQPTTDSSSNSF